MNRFPFLMRGSTVLILLLLTTLVYLPGLNGPWLSDDYSNLLRNEFVRLRTLDPTALYHAAFSLGSGPFHRPIPLASFALNHYFAGSFDDATPFKLTNLAVHFVNGLLVFWLVHIVLRLARQEAVTPAGAPQRSSAILAAAIALMWLVHPTQLTSVLYVVQRMTSLSAFFTLLALVCYLTGRLKAITGQRTGYALMFAGTPAVGVLGVFSKENALLLPVFVLALEYVLFWRELPWQWISASPVRKKVALSITIVLAVLLLVLAIRYALPGYANRPFTMGERLLTEARVMFFYLSLIVAPGIDRFGLHHDDIPISSSLLNPATTLPSVAGLLALFVLGLMARRRSPLLSLGLLWFFAGHLLESTFFPLEIAHEHRNYLPSLGILLALAGLLDIAADRTGWQRIWMVLPVLALSFGATTWLRATQWSSDNHFYAHEVLHHPGSAIAHYNFGTWLADQKRYQESEGVLCHAASLAPTDAYPLMWLQVVRVLQDRQPDADIRAEILRRLAKSRHDAAMRSTLDDVAGCLRVSCAAMRADLEAWLLALLNQKNTSADQSYYLYLLGLSQAAQGQIADALDSFRESYRLDPKYLHPLFAAASVYLQIGLIGEAEAVLADLRKANTITRHPRTREIDKLAAEISRRKTMDTVSKLPRQAE